MNPDERCMHEALELAERGRGQVEPNPMVGCLIVRDGAVLGRGYHEKFGGPHAEINALADCRASGHDPVGATLYVTLEPCCHFGKTGPCVEAIRQAGIARVICAVEDPTEKVAGKGLAMLRTWDIDVRTGVFEAEARTLNAPFFKYARTDEPWVILKWAQSADGFLANRRSRWISCDESRAHAHGIRRRCQAIVAGINTVIEDDPLLTPRPAYGRRPLRVIVDTRLMIPLNARVLDVSAAPTMIVVGGTAMRFAGRKVEAINQLGVDILVVSETRGHCDLSQVVKALGRQDVQQVLVEGGARILDAMIDQELGDELNVYIAPDELGPDGRIPASMRMLSLVHSAAAPLRRQSPSGRDTLIQAHLTPV